MKYSAPILAVFALLLSACNEDQTLSTNSPDALHFYNDGVQLFDKFYYTEAEKAFRQALLADTNFAMASARLAFLHVRTDNEEAAKKEIAKAIEHYVRTTRREQLYIRMLDHMIHFRNRQAASVADSFIALYPHDAEVYVVRGNLFELNKNFDAALEVYRNAANADTAYAPAAMTLGYAYSARGDFGKAITEMERYIRLSPDAADPRASFADILFRAGRYDEALDQYRASLDLKPDYWYAINRIGDVYATLGRLDDADKQFDLGMTKMLDNNQVRGTHLATEAVLSFQRGQYHEAIRLCEQSLTLDSTNGRAVFVRVNSLIKLKKFDEALTMIEAIRAELVRRDLTESQAMLEFHLLQAKFFEEQAMFENAIAACDTAMEYGSELTRTGVYQELAEIHLKKGDRDGALDALEEALRYNPNSPQALLILTKVYKAGGDKQMTKEIGSRLMDLWKDADSDFQPLIELQKLLGKSLSRAVS